MIALCTLGDAVFWRGCERVVIVLGGIIAIYLGYRLYCLGVVKGRTTSKLSWREVGEIAVAGGGPGMAFVGFGAFILGAALWTGGAKVENRNDNLEGGRLHLSEIESSNDSDILGEEPIKP